MLMVLSRCLRMLGTCITPMGFARAFLIEAMQRLCCSSLRHCRTLLICAAAPLSSALAVLCLSRAMPRHSISPPRYSSPSPIQAKPTLCVSPLRSASAARFIALAHRCTSLPLPMRNSALQFQCISLLSRCESTLRISPAWMSYAIPKPRRALPSLMLAVHCHCRARQYNTLAVQGHSLPLAFRHIASALLCDAFASLIKTLAALYAAFAQPFLAKAKLSSAIAYPAFLFPCSSAHFSTNAAQVLAFPAHC